MYSESTILMITVYREIVYIVACELKKISKKINLFCLTVAWHLRIEDIPGQRQTEKHQVRLVSWKTDSGRPF